MLSPKQEAQRCLSQECPFFASPSTNGPQRAAPCQALHSRRRQRRLRSWLRHERMTVAMALAERTHHSSRGQTIARAGVWGREMNYTATIRDPPTPQPELFQPVRRAGGARPDRLSEVRPQARDLRRTVDQFVGAVWASNFCAGCSFCPGIDIWRSCRFVGALMRALCLLPGGLGRFVPCSIGANHCRLRHIGWEKCGHGLTSRPRESASELFLNELLTLFRYLPKSGRALLNGTLPLRYCASRFAHSVSNFAVTGFWSGSWFNCCLS